MVSALQDAVNYPPDTKTHLKEGEFVYARLHSEDRQHIGSYEHADLPTLPAIKKYLSGTTVTTPKYGHPEYRPIVIDGRHYLDIHSQLTKSDSGHDIFLRTIFALSDQAVQSSRTLALQIIFYVIGIVLATSLLLYPVITRLINKLADYSTGLLAAQLETMEALGEAIAKRDSDTNSHNYRVTIYSVAMGERLGLDGQQMQRLIKGAFLHDVGKIGIRDNILLSKAKLNEREFAIMQKHVRYGLEIVEQSSWLRDAEDVVGCHHEKFDGSGYPVGLQGERIPLNARIFAIADVFDALTSKRPYKEPYSFTETMETMGRERSTHFDPLVLDVFTAIAEKLYETYSGREDKGLKSILQKITDTYFQSGIDTLRY